jgi:hypothetical protein
LSICYDEISLLKREERIKMREHRDERKGRRRE